ncbi:hypothetical protein LA345_38860 (plasmid) [Burkholderia vietnamiensis]|nr:hypothetical protein [Burkholderia vietnamiensis]
MKSFQVIVKTPDSMTLSYPAIGACSIDVLMDALEQHGLCKVTVRPL